MSGLDEKFAEDLNAGAKLLSVRSGVVGSEVEKLSVKQLREQLRAAVNAVDAVFDAYEALQGLKPELPPRPPDGTGLPRYGLRWNGPNEPLTVPMDDGYWTPAYLALAEVARLSDVLASRTVERNEAMASFREEQQEHAATLKLLTEARANFEACAEAAGVVNQCEGQGLQYGTRDEVVAEIRRMHHAREKAEAELDAAWKASGMSGTLRGMTTLDDVVASRVGNYQDLLEAYGVIAERAEKAESQASANEERLKAEIDHANKWHRQFCDAARARADLLMALEPLLDDAREFFPTASAEAITKVEAAMAAARKVR